MKLIRELLSVVYSGLSDWLRRRAARPVALLLLWKAERRIETRTLNHFGWAVNLALIEGGVFVFLAARSDPGARYGDLGALLGSAVRLSGSADPACPPRFSVTSAEGVTAWAWRRDGQGLGPGERRRVYSALTGRSRRGSELN